MVRRKVILTMIVFNALLGYTQQTIYYNKTINLEDNWASALSITNIGLDNIIATTGGPGYTMRMIKTDYWGNVQVVKSFSEVNSEYYPGFWGSLSYDRINESLDIGGNISRDFKDEVGTGFLMKINTACDSTLFREYKTQYTNSTIIINMSRPTSDSGYVLIGEDYAAQYNMNITLIKTDSIGNEQWRKIYGSQDSSEYGYTVTQTNDHGFLIGGIQYKPGNDLSGDTWIIKTDSVGNMEWDLKPGSPYFDRHAVVAQAKDGNYIAGTTIATYQEPGPIAPPAYRRINILKISTNGEIIWQKAYGRSLQNNNLASLIELEDGSIISVGYYDPYPEPFDKGWLLKVNQFGDSIWMREYWHFEEDAILNRLYDVDTTHDGGFIMAGQTMSETSPNDIQRIWLVKVDSAGCDTAGCDPTVFSQDVETDKFKFRLYPNPACDYVNLSTNCFTNTGGIIVIYNLFGIKQKEIRIPPGTNEASLSLDGIKNGSYILKVITAKENFTQRLIVIK